MPHLASPARLLVAAERQLALLDRAGSDPAELLSAQRVQLEPVAGSLHRKLARTTGFDRTIVAWRWEMVVATLRFLDDALSEPAT